VRVWENSAADYRRDLVGVSIDKKIGHNYKNLSNLPSRFILSSDVKLRLFTANSSPIHTSCRKFAEVNQKKHGGFRLSILGGHSTGE
jgi:hypothetical protein